MSDRFEDHAYETPFAKPSTLGDVIKARGWEKEVKPTNAGENLPDHKIDNIDYS